MDKHKEIIYISRINMNIIICITYIYMPTNSKYIIFIYKINLKILLVYR